MFQMATPQPSGTRRHAACAEGCISGDPSEKLYGGHAGDAPLTDETASYFFFVFLLFLFVRFFI